MNTLLSGIKDEWDSFLSLVQDKYKEEIEKHVRFGVGVAEIRVKEGDMKSLVSGILGDLLTIFVPPYGGTSENRFGPIYETSDRIILLGKVNPGLGIEEINSFNDSLSVVKGLWDLCQRGKIDGEKFLSKCNIKASELFRRDFEKALNDLDDGFPMNSLWLYLSMTRKICDKEGILWKGKKGAFSEDWILKKLIK